jgi:ABC-type lipoprotein release transport system permease subunit
MSSCLRPWHIYHTNPGYDESTIFMPLAKAQAITATENHASTIFVLLQTVEQADAVAQAIQSEQLQDPHLARAECIHYQFEDYANAFFMFYI